MGLRTLWRFYSFSVGIDFRRQNLTSVDVGFWRLRSFPTLKRLNITDRKKSIKDYTILFCIEKPKINKCSLCKQAGSAFWVFRALLFIFTRYFTIESFLKILQGFERKHNQPSQKTLHFLYSSKKNYNRIHSWIWPFKKIIIITKIKKSIRRPKKNLIVN